MTTHLDVEAAWTAAGPAGRMAMLAGAGYPTLAPVLAWTEWADLPPWLTGITLMEVL